MKVRCTMYVSKTLTSKFVFLSFWGVLLLILCEKNILKTIFFTILVLLKKIEKKNLYSAQCIAFLKKRLIKEIANLNFYR